MNGNHHEIIMIFRFRWMTTFFLTLPWYLMFKDPFIDVEILLLYHSAHITWQRIFCAQNNPMSSPMKIPCLIKKQSTMAHHNLTPKAPRRASERLLRQPPTGVWSATKWSGLDDLGIEIDMTGNGSDIPPIVLWWWLGDGSWCFTKTPKIYWGLWTSP